MSPPHCASRADRCLSRVSGRAHLGSAVYPLAGDPQLGHSPIPGMSIPQQFIGHDVAVVVGIGVAGTVGGVMLVEYLALRRLASAAPTLAPLATPRAARLCARRGGSTRPSSHSVGCPPAGGGPMRSEI